MSEKIKMVFITQNAAPFRMRWLDELSKFIDITVYHLSDYDFTVNPKYLSYVPENIKIFTCYRKILGHKFFKIKNILSEKADILVLDGYGFIAQIFLITYLRLCGIPFYMSVDGGIIPEKESGFKKFIKRFCLNGPSGFFSTSEITDKFIGHYLKKNVPFYRHYFSSVYSADINAVDGKDKVKYKIKLGLEDKFVVIAVGRFIPVKGFDILLRAVQKADNDICFVFVGGTPSEDYASLTKNIDPSNVKFIDFLSKEELKEYYFASDIFAIPSRSDVWGLVVGEAMSCGLPVLGSSNCVAAASMVKDGENGFIIGTEEPDDYLARIYELKNNPELLKKMSINNCEAIRKYTIDIAVLNDIKNIDKIMSMKNIEDCPDGKRNR